MGSCQGQIVRESCQRQIVKESCQGQIVRENRLHQEVDSEHQDRDLHCGGGCHRYNEDWRRWQDDRHHGEVLDVDPGLSVTSPEVDLVSQSAPSMCNKVKLL